MTLTANQASPRNDWSLAMALQAVDGLPARVLAIYAHPDDADVSCGGSLAYWVNAGSEVHLLLCALGDKGSADQNTDVAALVEERSSEVEAARSVLGISKVHRLSHRDGELENDLGLRAELVELIREVRPDAIVCPDPTAVFFGEHYYNHRDHRVVGWAALDAAAPAAGSPLYFPEKGEAFSAEVAYLSGSLEPNVYVDISSTIDQKADAVLCHKTQVGEAGESTRALFYERAEQAGRSVGVAFAEAFRRIHLSG